uniref:Uncharacterized protein n=1 Tax=Anguilla anguilla TaxID=7936 RepID=A0A0E9TWI9_ANGAN
MKTHSISVSVVYRPALLHFQVFLILKYCRG